MKNLLLSIVVIFALNGCESTTSTKVVQETDIDTPIGVKTQIQTPNVDAGEDKYIFENSSVQLSGTATDSDGNIVSQTWHNGNTLLSNDKIFTFTPTSVDTYTLTFSATDNSGNVSTDTMKLTVSPTSNVNQKPLVDAGKDQWEYLTSHTPITPTISDEDGIISSYMWKENGIVISNDKNLSYKPSTMGSHILSITATDNDGATQTDTVEVIGIDKLANMKRNASVLDMEGYVRVAINSTNILTPKTLNARGGTIVSYMWMQHNKHEILSQEATLSYTATELGNKTINIIVSYADGDTYYDQFDLEILPAQVTANAGNNIYAELNKEITITGDGINPDGTSVTYEWKDDNNNIISTSSSFSYTPTTMGNHDLTLRVSSDTSEFDASDTMTVTSIVAGETKQGRTIYDGLDPYKVLRTTLLQGRSDGKGLDFVIMGDGFTENEMHKFRDAAQTYANYIINYDEKLSNHKKAWNIHIVELVSNESGVDNSDFNGGIQVDTPLDTSFYCSNIPRLVCSNNHKVSVVSREFVPQYENVLIIANTTRGGGAGGMYATVTLYHLGKDTAVHELGHSLARLADEYYYPNGEHTGTREPRTANLTINTDINSVKWKHWVGEEVGLDSDGVMQKVGLFEGANYVPKGIWRPTKTSFMKEKGAPMNPINAEAWALNVYKYAKTHHSKTPQTKSFAQTQGNNTHFSVEASMGSDAQKITWYVDGVAQNISDDQFDFDYGEYQTQNYTVKAFIEDKTGAIRRDDNNYSSSTIAWSVNIN